MKKYLALLLISFLLFGCSSSGTVEKKTLMAGQNVKVVKDCFGATSQRAYDKLVNNTASQNVPAADKMRAEGTLIVLHTDDIAELTEVSMGTVKMKMLSGIAKGREIYTYRETVQKIDSNEMNKLTSVPSVKQPPKVTNNTLNFKMDDINKADITEQHRKIYGAWVKALDQKIANYDGLDERAVSVISQFQRKELDKSSTDRIEKLWEQMDAVRTSLLGFETPKGISPAADDQLWRMLVAYREGVNDRQATLWSIVNHLKGQRDYADTIHYVKGSEADKYFEQYESRRMGFKRIFSE